MKDWPTVLRGMDLVMVRPMKPPAEENPKPIVRKAVVDAGLVAFLERAHHQGGSVTILLNDPDRFTDSRTALEVVLEVAEKHCLSPDYRVLFATGSHSFSVDQMRRHETRVLPRAGNLLFEKAWHNCRSTDTARPAEKAPLHDWVVGGEHLLVIGSMEPHYFAGVTGAHKTLTVGVMSYESLCNNHCHAMSRLARGLRTHGNPVHEGIAAIVNQLTSSGKNVFAINEVLVEQSIVACFAGGPLESLEQGLPLVRNIYSHGLKETADLAVACVGPPLNKSLYQADKGIKNVENAVRDGGVILLDASCREGIGIDRFMQLMRRAPTYEEALAVVGAEGYRLGDHKAVRLRALTQKRGVRLGIISRHLGRQEVRVAGLEPFVDAVAAVRWARETLGSEKIRAVLVEDAGNTTVTLQD